MRNNRVKKIDKYSFYQRRWERIEPNVFIAAGMREYRCRYGVTQSSVARCMGLSSGYVCSLELGLSYWDEVKIHSFRHAVDKLK